MDTSENNVVSDQPLRPARPYLTNVSTHLRWRSLHTPTATESGPRILAVSMSQVQPSHSKEKLSPISVAPSQLSPPRSDALMAGYTASSENSASKGESTQSSSSNRATTSPKLRGGLHDSRKGWKCCDCGELNAPFFAECLRGMSQACGHSKCDDCARMVWR